MSGALVELKPSCMNKKCNTKLYYPANTSLFEFAWSKPTRFVGQNIEIYSGKGYGTVHKINLLDIEAHLLGAITVEYTAPAMRHKDESKIDHRYPDDSVFGKKGGKRGGKQRPSSKDDYDMPEHFCYYVQSYGHAVTEYAAIETAEGDILLHNSDYLEIADEISNPRSHSTDEIIVRCKTEKKLWRKSKNEQTYLVPLRFWFCEMIQAAVPLCNIDPNPSNNKFNLRIKTRDVHSSYYSSDGTIPRIADSNRELEASDLQVKVYADVYFVTEAEKEERKKRNLKYLFNQVQYNEPEQLAANTTATNAAHSLKLAFIGPIEEVLFVVQKEKWVIDKDFFNWSGENEDDPIKTISWKIGSAVQMSERSALWCRTLSFRHRHTNRQEQIIYSLNIRELR